MAGAELTSTLTIVDKSSNVLEAIGKQAERTSEIIDELIKTCSGVGSKIDDASDAVNDVAEKISGASVETVGFKDKFLAFTNAAMPAIYSFQSAVSLLNSTFRNLSESIGIGDDIAKTSRALHIGAESFQELSYVMQRGGASEEDFSMGLRTLNRQIADLKTGSSSAREAFGLLGLDIQDIDGKTLEQTLYSISNSLHNMDNIEDVDKVMQSLFGRGGYRIASAFSIGGDAIDKLREQARQTGSIMSEAETSLAEKGADKLLDAQLHIKSIWRQISNSVMPIVVSSLEKVSNFFNEHQQTITNIANGASKLIDLLITGITKISEIVSVVLEPAFDFISGAVESLSDNLLNIGDSFFRRRNNKSSKSTDVINSHIDNGVKSISKSIYGVSDELKRINESVNTQITSIDSFIKTQNARNGTMTSTDYIKQQMDEALKDSRVKEAERMARDSLPEGAYDALGLSDKLRIFNENYRKTTETGINDYQSYMDAEAEIERLASIDRQQTIIANEMNAKYKETVRELNDVNTKIKEMSALFDGFITGSDAINRYNELIERRNILNEKRDQYNEKYSEAYYNAIEASDTRKTFIDNIMKAEKQIAEYGKETAYNTRSVSINRDDIEFMKSMTTAEVINKYNTLSSSIVQNNHFAQAPTASSFSGITARGIQAAANSARAAL